MSGVVAWSTPGFFWDMQIPLPAFKSRASARWCGTVLARHWPDRGDDGPEDPRKQDCEEQPLRDQARHVLQQEERNACI